MDPGATGLVAGTGEAFVAAVFQLMTHPEQLAGIRVAARRSALQKAGDEVVESGLYHAYRRCLNECGPAGRAAMLLQAEADHDVQAKGEDAGAQQHADGQGEHPGEQQIPQRVHLQP